METMRLRRFWLHSKANLWPIPVLIVGAESALALALVGLDGRLRTGDGGAGWRHHLPAVAPDAAFNLLNLVAGSMMTVAATVFALTIVALTLASTQFTPRVMGNFMRSRVTQVALGVFLGIYAYCVLVMRGVRSADPPFVPALAMLGAVVLAFVGIGFLIFFILYLFSSIQVSVIAYRATTDSLGLIDRLMPEPLGDDGDGDAGAAPPAAAATPHDVASRRLGFIQSIDEEALYALARRRGTVVRVRRGSGSFVVAGEVVASLAEEPDEKTARAVEAAFTIGAFRTVDQDIAYGIWELVDIALKALSAAVNDTSTGVLCVNYLSAIMARAVQRRSPRALRPDEATGAPRLVRAVPTFGSLLDQAFDQIRHNATDNVAVVIRLLHALETLARLTRDPRRRADLLRHVGLVVDVAERSIRSPHERDEANAYLARMKEVWGGEWPGHRLSAAPPAEAAR